MKCENCGYEFEGDYCTRCGINGESDTNGLGFYSSVRDAINASNTLVFFNSKAIKRADSIIRPGEKIIGAVSGSGKEEAAIMVLTSERVFSFSSILGDKKYDEIALSDIKSVDLYKTWIQPSTITIYGMLVELQITLNKSAADEFYTLIMEAKNTYGKQHKSGNQSAFGTADYEALKQLNELYKEGILTEDEFNQKKKEILR
jgi:hypothetical protein